MLFPTMLVGSYPQPHWLIDRAKLADGKLRAMVEAAKLLRKEYA